jgi:hypothetical protein
MNKLTKLAAVILMATCGLGYSESKRTAEYLRLDPNSHVGKEVTVDVSMVKPVAWKSPVDDIAFFQALTIDRREDKSGGTILVAVPAADSEKFAKRYGMNFEGRGDKDRLDGTFILVSGDGPSGLWIIDTTGKLAKLIADKKLALPDAAREPGDGPGRRPLRGL